MSLSKTTHHTLMTNH